MWILVARVLSSLIAQRKQDRVRRRARRDFEIYSMNPDATGLTRLTNNPWADVNPTWSGDASYLAPSPINTVFPALFQQCLQAYRLV